jgi:hypothetical protein
VVSSIVDQQAHLQAVFDVVQWAVDSNLNFLPCGLCRTFELCSREPRWEIFHCTKCSVGELTLSF